MDFGKLFKSVEDAVYEVMVWILLLPKTLFLSMFKPKQAIQYVKSEWEKKPDDRFDEFLSPVLLWLIVAVLPLSLLAIMSDTDIQSAEDITKALSNKLLPMTLYAMIVPFIYIVWMEWVNKRPVKKSTVKRSFYMHCFALAPAQFLFGISALLIFDLNLFIFTTLVSVVLLAVYEAYVFQAELEITYKKAFAYAIAPQAVLIVLFILMFVLIMAIG